MGDENREKALSVRFSMDAVEDAEASAREGRPIYRDVPYVEIRTPGDKLSIVKRQVRDDPHDAASDVRRFPAQWAAFKAGDAEQLIGTPLSIWPALTASKAKELEHFGVRTVEQLAEMPDSHTQRMRGFDQLRQRARDFLRAAADGAPISQLRSEVEARDAEVMALKQQIDEQAKLLAELKRAKK